MLVDSLLEEAKRRELPKVMALTYEVSFFIKTALPSWKRRFSRRKCGPTAFTARSMPVTK